MSRGGRPPSPSVVQSAYDHAQRLWDLGMPLCPVCKGCGRTLPELVEACEVCRGTGLDPASSAYEYARYQQRQKQQRAEEGERPAPSLPPLQRRQ